MANPIKYSTVTNLVTYSEDFTNVSWGKSNVSVTGNTTSSPNTTLTADSLIENNVLSQHAITKSITLISGNIHTYSIYLKSNSRSISAVWMYDSTYNNGFGGDFNLTTSTVTNTSQGTGLSSGVNKITNVGNGWYRCSITGRIPTVTSFNLVIYLLNNSGVSNYTGDGTSNMYIWGAQLEIGSVATPYITTTVSSVTTGLTQSNSIQARNFSIGVNKGGYGPTNVTNFYNGKTPNVGGYTVYVSNGGTASPSVFVTSNDSTLITLSNQLGGSGITTIAAALNFFNASTTILCTNIDYPNIVTSGLVLNLDAAFTPSYPKNGTTWTDLSGNGNNGTLLNLPTYSSAGGGCIVSDGVDDGVTVPDNVNLDLTNFTLDGWVWFNQHKNYGSLLVKGPGGIGHLYNYCFFFYDTSIVCGFGDGSIFYAAGILPPPINTWHHIVGVYNSVTISFYLNGVLAQSNPIVATPYQNTDILNIIQVAYPIDGKVISAKVYNRALSSTEILQNYYAGLQRLIPTDGLVLSLDGSNTDKQVATASTVYDMSGNNNNGALNNGVALVSDGQRSFSFDGTNDSIYIPYSSTFNFSIEQTIIIWLKPGTGSQLYRRNPYNQAYGGSGTITHEQYGGFNYFFGTNGGNNLPYASFSSSFTVLENETAFIAVTRNQTTNTCNFYKNGVLTNTGTAGGYAATNNGSSPITIGSGYAGPSFIGNVGQLRLYNRALTATEISTIYTATKSRYGL